MKDTIIEVVVTAAFLYYSISVGAFILTNPDAELLETFFNLKNILLWRFEL